MGMLSCNSQIYLTHITKGDFSVEKETKIINWEQDSLYTTEYYQQFRE